MIVQTFPQVKIYWTIHYRRYFLTHHCPVGHIVIMFRLTQQRFTLLRPALPQVSARNMFSSCQQVYPVARHVPTQATPSTLIATANRQFELTKTLFEIQQMRIIPPALAEKLQEPVVVKEPTLAFDEEWLADSVLRKRRLKMKKHKLRKRRKAQRALRRKLKKD